MLFIFFINSLNIQFFFLSISLVSFFIWVFIKIILVLSNFSLYLQIF